jgi:hypothetical protein
VKNRNERRMRMKKTKTRIPDCEHAIAGRRLAAPSVWKKSASVAVGRELVFAVKLLLSNDEEIDGDETKNKTGTDFSIHRWRERERERERERTKKQRNRTACV